jgi:hypothetical protein
MDTDLDRIILMGTRVDMASYVIVDPLDDAITPVDLAWLAGRNELLRQLKGDSFHDIADVLAHA